MERLGLLYQEPDGPRMLQSPRGEPDLCVQWESFFFLDEDNLEEIERKKKKKKFLVRQRKGQNELPW